MSAPDPHLAEQLDRLVPETAMTSDWHAVVRGATRRRRRRRVVQLATAAAVFALGVSPVGGAVAHGVGDFSEWLSGEPGTPASESDQQSFERANQRSWDGFPPGTELRSLIKTTAGGHDFELFGFRSGDSLCLRAVARGLSGSPAVSCAPLAALRTASAPVLVMQADHGFGLPTSVPAGGGYAAPRAQATFGIVADGVQSVELTTDDATHAAIIASNAFLSVDDRPQVGTRVREVFAIGADGTRAAVPFQSAPFGEHNPVVPTHHDATGPVTVQRVVEGGTIGWLVRGEERGEAPPRGSAFLHALFGPHALFARLGLVRLIAPDPESHLRMLIGIDQPEPGLAPSDRTVCVFTIAGGAGGGCSSLHAMFTLAPFTLTESIDEGGDQYTTLGGVASDDVARMQLFLGSGEAQPIPLRDNAWLTRAARADYPIRVVAYDREDRIIGIQTMDTP